MKYQKLQVFIVAASLIIGCGGLIASNEISWQAGRLGMFTVGLWVIFDVVRHLASRSRS